LSKPTILSQDGPFDEAVRAYRSGGTIAYPTETFYGLGVDPFNPVAVERLFSLKGRAEDKPVALIIKDEGMLERVALVVPPDAKRLIRRFWPGPLTIILKAGPGIPPGLIGGTGKVGVRVSSNPVTERLLKALNAPLTATSANPAGKAPPRSPEEVISYFDGSIDVLIDGGRLKGRLASTVVDSTGVEVEILREGEVPADKIMEALSSP